MPRGETSQYAVFGLQVTSDIDLPELPRGTGPADVVIRTGPSPAPLVDPVVDSVLYQAAPGRLRLAPPMALPSKDHNRRVGPAGRMMAP